MHQSTMELVAEEVLCSITTASGMTVPRMTQFAGLDKIQDDCLRYIAFDETHQLEFLKTCRTYRFTCVSGSWRKSRLTFLASGLGNHLKVETT
jgi:hypothetical protein